MNKLGIYIHIPYCRSKCPYCDFFSLAHTDTSSGYTQRVCEEIERFFAENECKTDTLYIGGGTPSVLAPEQIVCMVECVKKHCRDAFCEITVECNPSDTGEEFLRAIYAAGVNRLSFGMQSAVERERRALGRRANREQVAAAVKCAQNIGFQNISLDLMLGIPGQTGESLRESIDFCVSLGVQHISAYILKIEPGTVFAKKRESLDLPPEDAVADLYLQAVEALEQAGYMQYEISNFALPGYESRHNLKYWRLQEYLGIGAAAHSFVAGKRFYYPRDIDYFLGGGVPIADGDGGDVQEQIMLGLRLKEGIPKSLLSEKAKEKLPFLRGQRLLSETEQTVALTPQGCLLSNTIINELSEV
ncbi:MAG: radical SAM family heme chaperone HemW [Clostridia bacterium]|nr:radical SAM family heme chaperone HemW [Clostridia bacterium]